MKGVILAGGTGTRLFPLTKAINKHLLPVGHVPMICHPLSTLTNGGIDDILIVCGGNHLAGFIDTLGEEFNGVPLTYRVQSMPDGIAGAIRRAERWVNNEDFVVILGDNIFDDDFKFNRIGGTRVYIQHHRNPEEYGVPEFDEEGKQIIGFEEKPRNPKSNYIVTGLYQFDKNVFDYIHKCRPSERGELEVTDVLNISRFNGITYKIVKGFWCDAGTFKGYSTANMHFIK